MQDVLETTVEFLREKNEKLHAELKVACQACRNAREALESEERHSARVEQQLRDAHSEIIDLKKALGLRRNSTTLRTLSEEIEKYYSPEGL